MDIARVDFQALGGQVVVACSGGQAALPTAHEAVRAEVAAIDAACSRFRADSELTRLNRAGGQAVPASALLREAVHVALRAAEGTDGIVVPTVGRALADAGYDRDFDTLPKRQRGASLARAAVPPWRAVEVDDSRGTVRIPADTTLDLGATAKALAADRAARAGAAASGSGVLVAASGDIATAGQAPPGGWVIGVAEHHAGQPAAVVRVEAGGVATSGTTARTWWRGRRRMHHVIDPRTGAPARVRWRTASVAAASCVDANIASTAAIILGRDAPGWLAGLGLAARLVDSHGRVVAVGGWPAEEAAAC